VVFAALIDRDLLRRRRVSVILVALIAVLALAETVNAVVAPAFAPTDKDWTAAAAKVRAGFRLGDLIVAAPAWADPVMRQQLGDLVPMPVAGRMDAARYGRIWEISQNSARAQETASAHGTSVATYGALQVKLWEKPAAMVTFDFLAQWRKAAVSVLTTARGTSPCLLASDHFQCAEGPSLKPQILEIDTGLRGALGVDPLERTTLAVDYGDVLLGRELAVAAGLHNVWLRKAGKGKVTMRVLMDGRALGTVEATSSSGWALQRFDTASLAGKSGNVRFEITADDARARHFGFAAEARNP
jgi:hypothetical protein